MVDVIETVELEGGWRIEVSRSDDAESPRAEDNLGHIVTWTASCLSPDDNPWARPEDFVEEMLSRLFAPGELCAAIEAGKLGSGPAGLISREQGDGPDDEGLARAVAQCAGAPRLLGEKMAIKTVYLLDHSGVSYSTAPFGDPWDSGAVGFAWATDEDALRWSGRAIDRAEAEGRLDEEVGRYSSWADGDTYGLELFDADGNAVEYVAGYIGEEDLEYGVAEMKALAAA